MGIISFLILRPSLTRSGRGEGRLVVRQQGRFLRPEFLTRAAPACRLSARRIVPRKLGRRWRRDGRRLASPAAFVRRPRPPLQRAAPSSGLRSLRFPVAG